MDMCGKCKVSQTQFFPKGEGVEKSQNLSTDATLYHGTGGEIEGGVVRPNEGVWGTGAYASELSSIAKIYAGNAAREQGRLFGTVYEVTPMSDKATHVSSEGGGAVLSDPEGLRTGNIVSFPPSFNKEHYKRANERADQIQKYGWSGIGLGD